MATYYMRGSFWHYLSGNANTWATSPTGTPLTNAVLPTSSDDVIFDLATPTLINVTGDPSCKTFTANGWFGGILCSQQVSGPAVNGITPARTGGLNVYGDVTMSAASFTKGCTLNIHATCNLTSNGAIFQNVTISDGAYVTLQDSLVCYNTGTLLLENGTLDCNNQSVAIGRFMTPKTNVSRVLNMGNGTWNILGSGSTIDISDHVWNDQSTSTFFTLNSGTSKIRFIPGSAFVLASDITSASTGNIFLVYGGQYANTSTFTLNETGYVVIDDEVMSFAGISLNESLVSFITITARGLNGTKKQPHVVLSPVIVLSGTPAKHFNSENSGATAHGFTLTPANYSSGQYIDSGYNSNTGGTSSINPKTITNTWLIGNSGNVVITECYYRVFSNSSYFRITLSGFANDPKKYAIAYITNGVKTLSPVHSVYSYQGGIASWTWPSNNSVVFAFGSAYWGGTATEITLGYALSTRITFQSSPNPLTLKNTYKFPGSVLVDGEVIRYSSITDITVLRWLDNIQRGTIYGSSPQSHANNTPVLPATSRSIFTGNKYFNNVEFWSGEQYVITRIYDNFTAAQLSNNRLGVQNLLFDATKTHTVGTYQIQGTNTQPIYVTGLPDSISTLGGGTVEFSADYQSSSAPLQIGDQYFAGQVDMLWGDYTISSPLTLSFFADSGSTLTTTNNFPGKFTKSGGIDAYNFHIYSTTSYSNGCYATAIGPTNSKVAFGLNFDPTPDKNYTSIDYCFLLQSNNWYIYESGTLQTSGSHTSALDVFTIVHDGSNITYYVNGVSKRTVAKGTGALFFDSSFSSVNSYLDQVDFRPYSDWKRKIKVVTDVDLSNFYSSLAGTFVKIILSDNINYITGSIFSWWPAFEGGGYTRWALVIELNTITKSTTATNNLWVESNGQIFFNSFKSAASTYGNLVSTAFPTGSGIPYTRLVGKTIKIKKTTGSADYIEGNVTYALNDIIYIRPLYSTYSQATTNTKLNDWYNQLQANKTSVPVTIPQSFSAFDAAPGIGFNVTVRVATPNYALDYFSSIVLNAIAPGAKYRITNIVGRSSSDYIDGTLITYELEYDIKIGDYTGYAIYTFFIQSSNFSRALAGTSAETITANFYAIPSSEYTRYWQLTSGTLTYRTQNDYNVVYEESVSNSPYNRSITLFSVCYNSVVYNRPDLDSYVSFNFNIPKNSQDTYKGGPNNPLSPGHTLIVLDPTADDANVVKSVTNFNTSQFSSDSVANMDSLATAINAVITGNIVVLVSKGGCSVNTNLKGALISCGRDALSEIFTSSISSPYSHCFIGRKGAAPGTALEDIGQASTPEHQVATVHAYFDSSGSILKYPSPAKQGLYCKIQSTNFNYPTNNPNSGVSYILVNGLAVYHTDFFGLSRGHIVVITDQYGTIITKERYDTWGYLTNLLLWDGSSDNAIPRMVTALNNAPLGSYCFITSFDAIGWNSNLITALRSYGSGITGMNYPLIVQNGAYNRYTYAFIGKKGSSPGTAKEIITVDYSKMYNLELFVEPDNSVLPFPNPRRSDLLDF